MNTLKKTSLLLPIFTAGCISLPQDGTLVMPLDEFPSSNVAVWVEQPTISAWSDSNGEKTKIESELYQNTERYLERTGAFTDIKKSPEEIGHNDQVLQFDFKEYTVEQTIHPAYFPLSIITLTMYIWFNGSMMVETIHYEGDLIVKDDSGKILNTFHAKEVNEVNKGIYDGNNPQEATKRAVNYRSSVVGKLVDQYVKSLAAEVETKPENAG